MEPLLRRIQLRTAADARTRGLCFAECGFTPKWRLPLGVTASPCPFGSEEGSSPKPRQRVHHQETAVLGSPPSVMFLLPDLHTAAQKLSFKMRTIKTHPRVLSECFVHISDFKNVSWRLGDNVLRDIFPQDCRYKIAARMGGRKGLV